ncbi:hypothetical protein LINPERPRIM_LOCUS13316, partial [Linum perenne]
LLSAPSGIVNRFLLSDCPFRFITIILCAPSHLTCIFSAIQAIAELGDLSFACKHMQEENLKLKEEVENLRSLRMDLTRYHNEEKRRADAATSTIESLKKSLAEATERVAQMEGVQEDLQAANERLAPLRPSWRRPIQRLPWLRR